MIYILVVAGVYLLQRKMLFFPDHRRPDPSRINMKSLEEVTLETEDGLLLLSWYIPPQDNKPTMVYFHGNGGHIGYRHEMIRPYVNDGYGVLLLEYRGYGGNPGKPTEEGLYLDAKAAMDFLETKNPSCTILYGESLGNAPAVTAASQYPVDGLILQAAFPSVAAVAKSHYPYLPVDLLLKDRFEIANHLKQLTLPLLFFHGTNDWIVPMRFGRQLYDIANPPKQFVYFKGASHNDLHAWNLAVHGKAFIEKVC